MKSDLTRWNRAGLKRLRYVDGNAATYLEALRQELFARLAGWDMELLGFESDDPQKRQDALAKYIARFGKDHQQALDNYQTLNDKRGSIALEMIRSFARAAHVLTEHLDAYANEGFLGTATQWENVRRLVYGLDYHPKPPASAMTHLVLHAKPGQSGLVARGLQIKHTPEGGSPVIFETLEDIEVDSALNALRLKDWDHPQETAQVENVGDNKQPGLVVDGIVEGLKPSDPVIIETEDGLLPCLLTGAAIEGGNTVLYLDLPSGRDLGPRSDVTVHLKPVETLEVYTPLKQQVLKAGASSLILTEEPVSPSEDEDLDYVFIGKGNTGVYRKVSGVNDRQIDLASGQEIYGNDLADRPLSAAEDYVGIPEKLDQGYVFQLTEQEQWDEWDETSKKILKEITGKEFVYLDDKVKNKKLFIVLGDKVQAENGLKDRDILVRTQGGFRICKVSDAESFEDDPNITQLTLDIPDPDTITHILLPPSANQWKWKIDSFVDITNESLEVGIVKRMARGDLCVVACGGNLVAVRVENVEKTGQERFVLQIDGGQSASVEQSDSFIRGQTVVWGKFKEQFHLEKSNINEERISGSGSSPRIEKAETAMRLKGDVEDETGLNGGRVSKDGNTGSGSNSSSLRIENAEAAKSLKPGKPIVVEQELSESRQSFLTSVKSVNIPDGDEGALVTLESPLSAGYTVGNTVIRANVVLVGHGETQPERILGSGNATLSHQEFLFPVAGVSFISDPAQDSGVRADIRIIVDDETWTQVSRFNQSRPGDPHYTVRMTEDGHLRIVFGDGVNGRRLPTGENNVRIAWRLGSGTVGNLDAGTLKKLAHPHPRVEAVDQPSRSTGGNDMESVASLRQSAPASLAAMGRAVSVKDFAERAASHSSIWNAHAELQSAGSDRAVRVIVVPAQGGELGKSLSRTLEAFLRSHAIPGVHVEVVDFVSKPLTLNITLAINSARFDVGDVQDEVRTTLLQRFTLKNRAIAAPVYLSDIYQCVEAVRGVEYSVCRFEVDGEESDKQFLYPGARGVLHIADGGGINLAHREVKK